MLPTLFANEGRLGVAAAKVGVPVVDGLRVGGGAQAFLLGEGAAGFVFGNATIGGPDLHGTVAGGAAVDFSTGDSIAGVTTLSLSKRLGPRTALITENWFVYFLIDEGGPWGGPVFVVPSGGARLFGPKFAVDLAIVPVFTNASELPVIPIPWVSFAWNFDAHSKENR